MTKPIRIAFSGSGFKAPAHVGALCAVVDAGFEPVEYAGTSGGSIVAALAACGTTPAELKSLALEMDWSGMLSFSPWSLLTKIAWCSGDALKTWLDSMTAGKVFGELKANLTVMASDLDSMAPAEFSTLKTPQASIALAVRASTAIPFVYAPVKFGRQVLVDGGLVNNIPADKLFSMTNCPRLGIQLVSQTTPIPDEGLTLASMAHRVVSLMLSSQESVHIDLDRYLGVKMAFVETGYADGLDTKMPRATRERLFSDGYKAAQEALATA